MKDDIEKTFSLDEVSGLVDMPKRTVRYYIQENMVDRPFGAGRSAHYTARHVEQLLSIKRWQQAGLSLERIRGILRGNAENLPPPAPRAGTVEVWSHLIIADGIELHIEPSQAGLTPSQVSALLSEVKLYIEALKHKG
jgi:DNA-binding transcriptional MerR regulator